jgi:hypothetical protein
MKVIYVSHLMKAWEVRKVIRSFKQIERKARKNNSNIYRFAITSDPKDLNKKSYALQSATF